MMNINSLISLMFEEEYLIPKRKPRKIKKLNPKTNRIKKFKKTQYHKTNIPPEKRTFRNKPDSVTFQQWLGIKAEKQGYGYSPYDGKWYGWSHRAVAGFKPGDKVKPDTCGNIRPDKEWIIKSEEEAKKQAMSFAKDVS